MLIVQSVICTYRRQLTVNKWTVSPTWDPLKPGWSFNWKENEWHRYINHTKTLAISALIFPIITHHTSKDESHVQQSISFHCLTSYYSYSGYVSPQYHHFCIPQQLLILHTQHLLYATAQLLHNARVLSPLWLGTDWTMAGAEGRTKWRFFFN